jgi:hypothetical protein
MLANCKEKLGQPSPYCCIGQSMKVLQYSPNFEIFWIQVAEWADELEGSNVDIYMYHVSLAALCVNTKSNKFTAESCTLYHYSLQSYVLCSKVLLPILPHQFKSPSQSNQIKSNPIPANCHVIDDLYLYT